MTNITSNADEKGNQNIKEKKMRLKGQRKSGAETQMQKQKQSIINEENKKESDKEL